MPEGPVQRALLVRVGLCAALAPFIYKYCIGALAQGAQPEGMIGSARALPRQSRGPALCKMADQLTEIAVAGERLLVGAYPLIDERWIKDLTESERQVAAQILAGSTNADIASRRDVSEHTVANQVQAIFRKLEVRSRGELAVRLQAGR
jgi:DNA-binding CsgD family transcriptional regulator